MKRRNTKIAVVFTILLFILLLIPLDGKVDNTFLFFLGRFHPIILHLPIGALIILFFMEVANGLRPQLNLEGACNLLLWFSVFSIVPTLLLGFLLGSSGSYDDELLNVHKWLGWFTALFCIWLVVLREKKSDDPSEGVSRFYKIFLFSNVLLLSLAGHYGGYLTHGEDYLTKYMPTAMKNVLGIEDTSSYYAVNTATDSTSQQAVYYQTKIQPILENHCYECHGPEKQKGAMRLDVLNWDMIKGPDAEKWHSAMNVINLGEMPPKKKPQLSDNDRRLVVEWMTENLNQAAIAKQSDNQKVMRRLTKAQYTNSLNELLGVYANFGDVLPDDGKSKMGFTNNGNILQTTALHVDYYQKIAREALDKAIVYGDKPKSKHYKVTLGKNIGDGKSGAEFGGYQTAPVDNENLKVELLSYDSSRTHEAPQNIQNNIGIGMRGSASNRYTMVEEGMVLNAALPAKEVTPKSWQGPSPNLKMLIKQDFPRSGYFAFRVEASKGYHSATKERLIDLRKDQAATVSPRTIAISAKNIKNTNGLVLKNNRWLVPKEVAKDVKTEFTYFIPKAGIYQIDLIHPYATADATPSYRISLFNKKKEGVVSRRLNLNTSLKNSDKITSPVTLAYLSEGEHKGYIGGKFFVGFSDLLFTPLPEDDPLPKILEEEVRLDNLKYEDVNPSMQVFLGSRTDDGMDYKTLGSPIEVTAAVGAFESYEFTGRLENFPVPLGSDDVSGDLANILTLGLWNNHLVKESSQKGPPLLVRSVAFEVPYYPQWPPESHTKIFFDSPNKNNRETYAQEVVERFLTRAFRRPPKLGELERYMGFWKEIKDDFDLFEDSVKEVLVAVLCSPNFIYLLEPESNETEAFDDQNFLASQLSYFLWNSPPDETLTQLAAEGDLGDELEDQIDRMIESPKIMELVNAFTYEWLRLDRHKTMDVDVHKYEDYTRFVKEDMFKETYNFVHYVLEQDLSILNFIDSDFAMLNQNLAEFYGIEGVEGNTFRPVPLEKKEERGGLLSQGSFLSGHSDGTQAHAIKRAVWLKEKILGEHPPPPPPNVPDLDPETPGFEKLTLKEQLFLHRNKASCMDCHRKIDPFGVVFENYDAVGRFQQLAKDKPIDVKSELPDGTEIEGIQGIKEYILKLKKDEFTKSLVKNLFAYALGRDIGFADEKEINNIVEEVIDDNYRFRTVIKEIVSSPSFYKEEQSWFNKIVGR